MHRHCAKLSSRRRDVKRGRGASLDVELLLEGTASLVTPPRDTGPPLLDEPTDDDYCTLLASSSITRRPVAGIRVRSPLFAVRRPNDRHPRALRSFYPHPGAVPGTYDRRRRLAGRTLNQKLPTASLSPQSHFRKVRCVKKGYSHLDSLYGYILFYKAITRRNRRVYFRLTKRKYYHLLSNADIESNNK